MPQPDSSAFDGCLAAVDSGNRRAADVELLVLRYARAGHLDRGLRNGRRAGLPVGEIQSCAMDEKQASSAIVANRRGSTSDFGNAALVRY